MTLRATNEDGMLRAAFRDAHGARLHGFALLVTLGDAPLAASLSADALDAGARDADELRHPERAAAWLRGHVVRNLPRHSSRRDGRATDQARSVLASLGVDEGTFDVLEQFSPVQRAALVAGDVEGLAPLDLELVLDAPSRSVQRRRADARRRFLERRSATTHRIGSAGLEPAPGQLEQRIRSIADQALARHSR